MFTMANEREMTTDVLSEYIEKHRKEQHRYKLLKAAYESAHDILYAPAKAKWKPDNRIVANFPKYAVDTMNGFFLGNPIKVSADDEKVSKCVEYIDQRNAQDDNNAELSKICDIYGKGYEMYYADEYSELCITYLSPLDAFMIFDNSILHRPLFFIRYYVDENNVERGSVSDETCIRYFQTNGGCIWTSEWEMHFFDGVPATRYVENEECQGLFEPVMSMVNAYNKALSEKANDVDYFADAYLKILGPSVDDEDIKFIRDNRVVNFVGDGKDVVVAEFMDKPSSDTSQENMLNRLERLIFQISMVANISDETFGTASGIAMKYKLQAMMNLAKAKERKFVKGMTRRYQLLFSNPLSKVHKDDWVQLQYTFTPNIPANLLEESQIAQNLSGVVSKETQLKALSIVDNVKTELDKMDEEDTKLIPDVTATMFNEKVPASEPEE